METTEFYIGDLPESAESAVFDILCDCDSEFYPPLSSRSSTTQKTLGEPDAKNDTPAEYFKELKKQKFILVYTENELSAFLSYRIPENERRFYVSTLCVKPKFRGRGLLHLLYDRLEQIAVTEAVAVLSTRTWSTNEAQIKTLGKHGYHITKSIENDRPNGVGTIYFEKVVNTDTFV